MSDKRELNYRVAAVQMHPNVGEKEKNVENMMEFINEASDNKAKLIVFPELAVSGYTFDTREEAFYLAETIPDGKSTMKFIDTAKKKEIYISYGITEIDEGKLFNTCVLVGPSGYIGTFRKLHLWHNEKMFFEPGNLGVPVFFTPIGRIAMLNCYDIWFPESWRLAALKGADIVCVNTCWVPILGQDSKLLPMADYLCMTGAHSNAVFVVAACRIGVERKQPFIGHSIITNPLGFPIGGPASEDKEEILYADINISDARRGKTWSELNGPLRDRRKDVYDEMLGSQENPLYSW
jgi:predicted amidohydrolase